jgi:hypothetical protein
LSLYSRSPSYLKTSGYLLIDLIMNCDRRHTLFAPINTFNFTTNDRVRRYSTPERQDLETIYEVNKKKNSISMKKENFVFLID